MGKMVIYSMYIIWKKYSLPPFTRAHLDFIYYNNIILYISDNTHILPIPHKKTGVAELISTVGSIDHFLLHTSHFQPVVLCTVKKNSSSKPHDLTNNTNTHVGIKFFFQAPPYTL
jgi:hypothetical protein